MPQDVRLIPTCDSIYRRQGRTIARHGKRCTFDLVEGDVRSHPLPCPTRGFRTSAVAIDSSSAVSGLNRPTFGRPKKKESGALAQPLCFHGCGGRI